jgi:hypothetical protein
MSKSAANVAESIEYDFFANIIEPVCLLDTAFLLSQGSLERVLASYHGTSKIWTSWHSLPTNTTAINHILERVETGSGHIAPDGEGGMRNNTNFVIM